MHFIESLFCTRRFHELVCIPIQPPSLSFLTPRSCVRYFVRLIVIAISWRHRALPVLARRRCPGQVVGFTSRASTPPSRCSQTAPWRRRCGCRGRSPVSTGGCRRQIPCRSLSSGSQQHSQKVRSFSSFRTKGTPRVRARDEAIGRWRVSKALRERGGKPGKRRGGRVLTDGALNALAAGHIHAALLQFHAALADHALGRPDALPAAKGATG